MPPLPTRAPISRDAPADGRAVPDVPPAAPAAAARALAAAGGLGVLGDLLLRAPAPGLGLPVLVAALLVAGAGLARRAGWPLTLGAALLDRRAPRAAGLPDAITAGGLAARARLRGVGLGVRETTVALALVDALFVGFGALQLRWLFGGAAARRRSRQRGSRWPSTRAAASSSSSPWPRSRCRCCASRMAWWGRERRRPPRGARTAPSGWRPGCWCRCFSCSSPRPPTACASTATRSGSPRPASTPRRS